MIFDNELTQRIIGCAIDVHRVLGPCFRERSYEEALALELEAPRIAFHRQPIIAVAYRGCSVGEYRIDFVVEKSVVVEVKSVTRFDPVFEAQILGHLRASGLQIGLLVNFNSARLADGVRRYVLQMRHPSGLSVSPWQIPSGCSVALACSRPAPAAIISPCRGSRSIGSSKTRTPS